MQQENSSFLCQLTLNKITEIENACKCTYCTLGPAYISSVHVQSFAEVAPSKVIVH